MPTNFPFPSSFPAAVNLSPFSSMGLDALPPFSSTGLDALSPFPSVGSETFQPETSTRKAVSPPADRNRTHCIRRGLWRLRHQSPHTTCSANTWHTSIFLSWGQPSYSCITCMSVFIMCEVTEEHFLYPYDQSIYKKGGKCEFSSQNAAPA